MKTCIKADDWMIVAALVSIHRGCITCYLWSDSWLTFDSFSRLDTAYQSSFVREMPGA